MVLAMLLTVAIHVVTYLGYLRLSAVTLPPNEVVFDAYLVPFVPKAPAKKPTAKPASPASQERVIIAPPGATAAPFMPFAPLAPTPSDGAASTGSGTGTAASTPTAIASQFAAVPTARMTWPELPAHVAATYQLTSSIVDGRAEILWKRDGTHYESSTTLRANGFFAEMFVGTIRQISRGEVTRAGLRPELFTLARGSGEPESAEFLAESNELRTKSRGETKVARLQPGLQDMQSFLFQMGIDANRFDSPEARAKVTVTNARKVYQYTFRRVADETVQLAAGPLLAWHLVSETTDPDDVYEIWLAPELHHFPVKMKFHLGRYVVEQTATSISSADE